MSENTISMGFCQLSLPCALYERSVLYMNDKATVKNMIVFFLAFLFTQKKKLKCVAFSIIAHYCTGYTFNYKLEEPTNAQFLYGETPV